MKLSLEGKRHLRKYLSSIPRCLIEQNVLEELEINREIESENRVDQLLKIYDDNLSITIFRKIWRVVELVKFFQTKCSIYNVEPIEMNFKSVRRRIKRFVSDNEKLIALELAPNPQIIMIKKSIDVKYKSLVDKMLATDGATDTVYWLPEKGLLLGNMHNDNVAKQFMENIESEVVGIITEKRLRSMELTKYYKEQKTITRVRISSVAQITGFNGLDHIQFQGEDIKRGAYGLQQRQEIDIRGLDTVGPNIEIASDDLHLYTGSNVIIKSFAGIDQLIQLLNEKDN
ncbi:MAG: hypothetical protein INQ03_14960 [Candidatus Heimdallarchaeota archaeon]|nr:hypothetical protein [Candidatus Heimdallarchaeota archaeon]